MTLPSVALVRQRYTLAGGAERFVARTMQAMQREGAAITLIARAWDGAKGTAGVVTLDPFYLGRTWRDWAFARAVCRHVSATHYDLVQSHERLPCCDVYRAGDGVHREWLHQRGRVLGPLRRALMWANPYHRYVLAQEAAIFRGRRVRAVVCNSRMVRDEIVRHYGTESPRLEVIYNGIDTEHFGLAERARLRAPQRKALGIPEGVLALVHVGSGFERKGVAVSLEAAARSRTNCHVIVVGGDKQASRYRALAQRLGIAGRTHFVGVCADARPYYAAADAFVMPSLYEPFSNAVLEAAAMGLPIVASTKSGAAEVLEPAVSGYVHDALDADGIAASVASLADLARCAQMGAAARRMAEGFSLDAMARQLSALYARLLSRAS